MCMQPLPWEPRQLPGNVKLVDLGGGGLAELVGLKVRYAGHGCHHCAHVLLPLMAIVCH